MSKPRICEILGVEPMEMFQPKNIVDLTVFYRIDSDGHLQFSSDRGKFWRSMASQEVLEELINYGITKVLYVSTKQLEYLRVLNDLFRPETLHKDCYGLYIQREKNCLVRIPEFSCLNSLFDASWSTINIPEILERYKEVPNEQHGKDDSSRYAQGSSTRSGTGR